MVCRGLAAALAVVVSGVHAAPFPVEIIEQFDDARVVAFVSETDIEAAPAWRPVAQRPPLDIAGVVTAVVRFYHRHDPDAPALRIDEIELRRLPRHADRWHYLVRAWTARDVYYVVLMDGKVIPALAEGESVK